MKFKFGRSSQEKQQQIDKINSKIEKVEPKINDIKEFIDSME